jgi:uncharacterized membrane protein YphA (DoxX/SURF4 family)
MTITTGRTTGHGSATTRVNVLLWTIQLLLAALFLFAGTMKFVMPIEAMTREIPLPGAFLHFIGSAEIAGALGLVLPGIFHVRRELTWLAAVGLVIIMSGATTLTVTGPHPSQAVMPLIVGLLLALVAHRRGTPAWPRGRAKARAMAAIG